LTAKIDIKVSLGVFVGGEEVNAHVEIQDRAISIMFWESVRLYPGTEVQIRPIVERVTGIEHENTT
jgi:hypothetical protein